jgi:hypothetical protein
MKGGRNFGIRILFKLHVLRVFDGNNRQENGIKYDL